MKYLCLVYIDEKTRDGLSKNDYDAMVAQAHAYNEELRKGGHFIAAEALQSVEAATTVRHRQGTMSVTDGPFAETKEQLGGFILIDAHDLDEAIRIASKIPPGRLGAIEVRPIKELPRHPTSNS